MFTLCILSVCIDELISSHCTRGMLLIYTETCATLAENNMHAMQQREGQQGSRELIFRATESLR